MRRTLPSVIILNNNIGQFFSQKGSSICTTTENSDLLNPHVLSKNLWKNNNTKIRSIWFSTNENNLKCIIPLSHSFSSSSCIRYLHWRKTMQYPVAQHSTGSWLILVHRAQQHRTCRFQSECLKGQREWHPHMRTSSSSDTSPSQQSALEQGWWHATPLMIWWSHKLARRCGKVLRVPEDRSSRLQW